VDRVERGSVEGVERRLCINMNRKRSRVSLNCSLTAPTTTQEGCHTPNTPEILNTIVNITSQLEQHQVANMTILQHPSLPSPSHSDISSSSNSSLYSPMTPTLISPQEACSTVQDFHSQFIKEGLKMKVKQKLKNEPQEFEHYMAIKRENEDFSPQDVSRRQKRRERNKVAAEKCRNKKKKETLNLFSESEVVERQNACYKDDIARLEAEQKHLMNILAQHQPVCKKRMKSDTSSQAHPSSWHFDNSNTFRVPNVPPSKDQKGGAVNPQLKTEPGEIFLPGDAGDYLTGQSDWKMKSDENIIPSYSFKRSSNQGNEEAKYSSLSYPGYSLGYGYYGGLVAM